MQASLRSSVADAATFSLMVGMGETYLPAFVLAVGLGEVVAGLAATLPMLAGAGLQLLSPRLIPQVGSHRRWVIVCATVQGLSFVPLTLAALHGRVAAVAVLGIATLYWGAGIAAGPAWNTWMARAVPVEVRAPFFARRSRVAQIFVLGGLFVGGLVLQQTAARGTALAGFAVIFAAACCFRLVSAVFLARQPEPAAYADREQNVPLIAFITRLRHRESRLLMYMLVVQVFTYIAAPFFTPYMLGELKLGYSTYMVLLATAFLAKAIALPTAARLAQRFGARALLWVGGVGVVPLAGLWTLSSATGFLAVMQVVGGIAWACYEFATFLLLFDAFRDEERTAMLTCYNFLNAAAIAAGSVLGGLLLRGVGTGVAAYMVVFLVSTVGRLATLLLLRTVPDVAVTPQPLTVRVLAVRPSAGSDDRPIVAVDEGYDAAAPSP